MPKVKGLVYFIKEPRFESLISITLVIYYIHNTYTSQRKIYWQSISANVDLKDCLLECWLRYNTNLTLIVNDGGILMDLALS